MSSKPSSKESPWYGIQLKAGQGASPPTNWLKEAIPLGKPLGEDGGFTLEQLQEGVGGYIQLMPQCVEVNGVTCDVYVDEEGLLKGRDINTYASFIFRQPIVGDVLIVPLEYSK